jgi:hypothetical protein
VDPTLIGRQLKSPAQQEIVRDSNEERKMRMMQLEEMKSVRVARRCE